VTKNYSRVSLKKERRYNAPNVTLFDDHFLGWDSDEKPIQNFLHFERNRCNTINVTLSKMKTGEIERNRGISERAGDEARTRDVHLGKVVLYQLSYTRSLRGTNNVQ
jgi:hypothetical protein